MYVFVRLDISFANIQIGEIYTNSAFIHFRNFQNSIYIFNLSTYKQVDLLWIFINRIRIDMASIYKIVNLYNQNPNYTNYGSIQYDELYNCE